MNKTRKTLAVAVAAMTVGIATAAQAQLVGTTIDASYRWPDLSTIRNNSTFDPASFVVGNSLESVVTGDNYSATVNFSDSSLSLIFVTDGVTFANFAPFHGFVFDGDGFINFGNAVILGSTTVNDPDFDASDVVLAGNRLTLNLAGTRIEGFQRIDIGFGEAQAAVPEPASWAMMIAGFALAGAVLRRRQNWTVQQAHS